VRPPVHHQPKDVRGYSDPPQEGMSAFKKLVAQMGGQPEPSNRPEAGVPFSGPVVRPNPIAASVPSNAPTEQEILDHMMQGGMQGPQLRAPPKVVGGGLPPLPPALAAYLATHTINTELLARPEAEQVVRGLNAGTISLDAVLQQLSNPSLHQAQRDLLLSVLKLKTVGPRQTLPPPIQPQLSRVSPVPGSADPGLMLLGAGGGGGAPLGPGSRVSPLMFPGGPAPGPGGPVGPVGPVPAPGVGGGHLCVSPVPQARVPSPQEMTVLTQHIMQQALIKRKLEEQKENFRRRQTDDTSATSAPGGGLQPQPPNNSSPLSFTPTSVMRKTAADRKDSDPRVQALVPELKVTSGNCGAPLAPPEPRDCPPSPGRPITKSSEERPGSLELGPPGGRPQPRFQGGPLPGGQAQAQAGPGALPGPQNHPLLYLQNNKAMGHFNPAMLNQATAMAQHQLLLAHGLDPRLARLGGAGHGQGGQPGVQGGVPGPVSPSRTQAPPFMQPMPNQGNVNLARFFSPEVLAQAQSGAVPAMPPLPTQKVLTLEEIERQAATVRI